MTSKKALPIILVCIMLQVMQSCKFRQRVNLIVHNATIYTVDSDFSVAQAMAINEGKIVETGTEEEILRKYEADTVVNAHGKYIYPGFIDAHCHFTGFATDMWKCELTGTKSFAEIIRKVEAYSKTAPMDWIYGRGWDQNDWEIKEFPDKTLLDSLYPNRPVFLKRIDGHAALVNQKALDIAGITDSTVISGGSVEKKNGRITGVLIDNAMDIVDNKVPLLSDSMAKVYYLQMQDKCFAEGLTGVHDCGVSEHTVKLIDEAQKEGRLKMKIFALLSDSINYYQKWISSGPYKTPLLHVGGFKLYVDGALGSRGACLLTDYSDKPGWKGFILNDTNYYRQVANKLVTSGLQMCSHAIGDSGVRFILKVYGEVLKNNNDRRWRIEHAQVIDFSDFRYFSDYNIIPSVQPTHATSDMYWAEERLGKSRLGNAYAYQKLLNTNGWLPLGTDFPVENISPVKTFYAAIVRKDSSGYPSTGFQTENSLSRKDALKGMTIWAAKAAFEEKEKGSLQRGKAADFVLLDTDIMDCKEDKLRTVKVISTYINGSLVFRVKD